MSPALVALLRGALEAAALAFLAAVIVWVSSADLGSLAPWAPIGMLVLRQLEGIIDQHIDPTTQRSLGGAPQ
jgi:hypothetical protein